MLDDCYGNRSDRPCSWREDPRFARHPTARRSIHSTPAGTGVDLPLIHGIQEARRRSRDGAQRWGMPVAPQLTSAAPALQLCSSASVRGSRSPTAAESVGAPFSHRLMLARWRRRGRQRADDRAAPAPRDGTAADLRLQRFQHSGAAAVQAAVLQLVHRRQRGVGCGPQPGLSRLLCGALVIAAGPWSLLATPAAADRRALPLPPFAQTAPCTQPPQSTRSSCCCPCWRGAAGR